MFVPAPSSEATTITLGKVTKMSPTAWRSSSIRLPLLALRSLIVHSPDDRDTEQNARYSDEREPDADPLKRVGKFGAGMACRIRVLVLPEPDADCSRDTREDRSGDQ